MIKLDRYDREFTVEEEMDDMSYTVSTRLNDLYEHDFEDEPGQKIFYHSGDKIFRHFKKGFETKRISFKSFLNRNVRTIEIYENEVEGPHYTYILDDEIKIQSNFFFEGKEVSEQEYNILVLERELNNIPKNNVISKVFKF